MIGLVRKNKRAAREARTLEKFRAVLCQTPTSNYHGTMHMRFWWQLEPAHKRKSLILCILLNGAHTNPLEAYFANIEECEQDGIIAK